MKTSRILLVTALATTLLASGCATRLNHAGHGASDGEAALSLDHQRAGGRAGIVSGMVQAGGAATGEKRRGEGGDQDDAGCLHLIPSMRRQGPV